MGRFLTLVVDYKHKIGFKGQILIEPKPKEPTTHQYDFDVATVYSFLKHFGLEKEVRVNIEANHALLAGHTFEHEIATATALGFLGSLDINRGDALLGWDTDQFPNDLWSMTMSMYHVIKGGGLTQGGCNFDAKVRRQSFTPEDLIHAHVGGADLCARAFLTAAKLIEDGRYDKILADRYADWKKPEAAAILEGKVLARRDRSPCAQEQHRPEAAFRQAGTNREFPGSHDLHGQILRSSSGSVLDTVPGRCRGTIDMRLALLSQGGSPANLRMATRANRR